MRMSAAAVAVSRALAGVQIRPDYIPMVGGLDITTPPYQRKPGLCRSAQNFEQTINGGYRRIAGYERYDGRPAPSDASYAIITATITGSPVVGNTLTGAAGATGVIIALPGGAFVLTKVSGTFVDGENLNVGGPTIAVATSVAITNGASTSLLHATYLNLAADEYRDDIVVPTGSGKILGGFYYNDVNYVFRNNAGGTAANMWKTKAGGWSQVAFASEGAYTSGSGAATIIDGGTLTQGAVTATIRRVLVRTGTLAGGTAAGTMVISVAAGGNFAAGAATVGAGTLTLDGAETAVTLSPSGRFETIKENFGGAANTTRVYGCDEVNRGWEFDGTYFVPIPTGMTTDTPTHVKAHKKHLVFSFAGSAQISSIGAPYTWPPLTGATEIGMGDTITGFGGQPGDAVGGALAIFTRNRLSILYGSSASDWNLVPYRDEIGAYANTIQDVGFTVFLDDRGITDIQTSQSYGNFAHNAISNQIRERVNEYRPSVVASAISRDLSQYRLFFTNNYAFYVTVVGRKVIGIMPVLFPDVVRCAWTSEKADGTEVAFFGSDSGQVFQMEKGTSFDGDEIEFSIDLAYNFQKMPRVEKGYKDATLEISGTGYAAFSFGFSLGYGSTDIPQPSLVSVTTNFSAVYWDSFTWDAFVWHGVTLMQNSLDIDASAENISLAIQGSSDIYVPFTLTGAVIHYASRRRLRP